MSDHLAVAYANVYAFLVEQGHDKAAASVKKAARPIVDLDQSPTVGPRSLLSLLERHVLGANNLVNGDRSLSSSGESDSSDDERPKAPNLPKSEPAAVLNGSKPAGGKHKAPVSPSSSSSSSSSESESDSESSSSSSESSSSGSTDSDSDDERAENKTGQKALSKTAVKKSSESSSSSSSAPSSTDGSSSSESEPESEAPPAKKRKLAVPASTQPTATTTTKTKTVEVTADSVTVTKSTTTESTSRPDKDNKNKGSRQPVVSFSRIKTDEVVYADPRLMDNRFEAKGGTTGDFGERASRDLIVTRGAGFRKEKNKKKRGSYRGGEITMQSHSIKFT